MASRRRILQRRILLRRILLRRILLPVAVAAVCAVLTSCGGVQDDDAADAAREFEAALADGDGGRACELLAPRTRSELQQSTGSPCEEAVLEEVSPATGSPEQVGSYGTMAQVRFAEDTLFLTRFDSGWKVLAAACTPPSEPGAYECQVKGA